MRITHVLVVLFGCFMTACAARAELGEELVVPRLMADVSGIKAGEPFTAGVLLKIAPGWHVYWKNPGDSGESVSVKWNLPEGFTASELNFPAPAKFPLGGGLINFGYEREVLLTATITPPRDLPTGSAVPIEAEVTWLVCEKTCIPGDATLKLTLPVTTEPRPANKQEFDRWQRQMPVPVDSQPDIDSVEWEKPQTRAEGAGQLAFRVLWKDQPPANPEWFPPPSDDLIFKNIATRAGNGSKATEIEFDVELLQGRSISGATVESVLAYTDAKGNRRAVTIPVDVGGVIAVGK